MHFWYDHGAVIANSRVNWHAFMSEPAESTNPPTFETSLDQLQTIVGELEEGKLGLEQSLDRFEEGVRLLRGCYRILGQAEQRIEILTRFDDGREVVTAPFDLPATVETVSEKKPKRRSQGNRPPAPGRDPGESPDEQRLF
jgi:exodeoxyribonuclease VII small subunit